jgi:hypothetical protein
MHDQISAMAALTVSPKRQHLGLYLHFRPRNFQATEVADFLCTLLRHVRGHIMLCWDRGSIHPVPVIEAVCKVHPQLYPGEFPAYAPEINSTAQVQFPVAVTSMKSYALLMQSSIKCQHLWLIDSSRVVTSRIITACINSYGPRFSSTLLQSHGKLW